jgi:hypothetical protein
MTRTGKFNTRQIVLKTIFELQWQPAALFYTLCETAKLVGVDVHAYLLRALYAAMAEPGALTYPEDLLMSAPTT